MLEQAEDVSGADRVLSKLEGGRCTFCERGELVREVYKSNDAVVCRNCGVPGAQSW